MATGAKAQAWRTLLTTQLSPDVRGGCGCISVVTRTRRVPGDTTSEWFGRTYGEGTHSDILLPEGETAMLEIAVAPAAHGDAGLGPLRRIVWLGAPAGQELQFDITARVVL